MVERPINPARERWATHRAACRRALASMLLAAIALLAPALASAQAYPSRPVKLVVPFPPGGSLDITGRLIAQRLTEMWGQSVIVENKPGAGGNIGADFVAKSTPELPTMAEAGLPGFDISTWYGLFAPSGTPATVVAKSNADVTKILTTPDVRAKLMADGAEPAPNTPEQFAQMIARELTKYARIVKISGAKVD